MASQKGIHFTLAVPKKRDHNALILAQAKGEAQKPSRMLDKRHKSSRGKEDWEEELLDEEEETNCP